MKIYSVVGVKIDSLVGCKTQFITSVCQGMKNAGRGILLLPNYREVIAPIVVVGAAVIQNVYEMQIKV